jgi:DoxX-like family
MSESMNKQTICYWLCTGLIALAFLSGGIVDLMRPSFAIDGMTRLGYPPYFVLILGFWKVLGGAAILWPALPLIKEWAYAGIFFDLTGASASHLASGDVMFHVAAPIAMAGLLAMSWAMRPDSRRLKLN